jgi:hypothetical protein
MVPVTMLMFVHRRRHWRWSWQTVGIHLVWCTLGVLFPVFLYLGWIGEDLPEWWRLQQYLVTTDATGGDFSSFNIDNIWYFFQTTFLHWNFDFDYKPYGLLAVHRQRVWLGFPWGWTFSLAILYHIGRAILSFWHNSNMSRQRTDRWIAGLLALSVLAPAIFFPKAENCEYHLPFQLICLIGLGILLADLLRQRHLGFRAIGSALIIGIVFLRLYYNVNVFHATMNEPSYEWYTGQVRNAVPIHSSEVIFVPYLLMEKFFQDDYFDYHVLRGSEMAYPIALFETALRHKAMVIINEHEYYVILNAARAIAQSDFYREVTQVSSKYYGTTTVYGPDSPDREKWIPFESKKTETGDVLLDLKVNSPVRIGTLFIRYAQKRSVLPEIWGATGEGEYQRLALSPEDLIQSEDGLFWSSKDPSPTLSRLLIRGASAQDYLMLGKR